MSALKDKIQKSITEAMKAKNAPRLQSLRLMFNAIRKKEIDERKDLNDAEIEKTLQTMTKQVQETLAQAQSAGRADAVAEAQAEIQLIKEFLPESMSEADVLKQVFAIVEKLKSEGKLPQGGAAIGPAMKESMAAIGSKADGKVVQQAVRKALGIG